MNAAGRIRPGWRPGILALACLLAGGCVLAPKKGDDSWIGMWSAPSLSRPATPILITLSPNGRATEQVGCYRGTGTWRIVDRAALIIWASGWRGVLRRAGDAVELRTWKAGSDPDGPPDDVQPARRH